MFRRLLIASLATVGFASSAHAQSGDSVLAISTDNDLFAPTQTDRDYTAGLAITYSSNSAEFIDNPVSQVSQGLDGVLLPVLGGRVEIPKSAALELGAYGFTPEEISASDIDRSDRPYSSLVYLSASQSYESPDADSGWTTSMTVGVLGLNAFNASQNAVHKLVGSDRANGWDHQISDGGEATLRYSAAYHQYLDASQPNQKYKVTYFGSVGYLTEFGAALVFRDGLISSPDNRFNPELMAYGERAPGVSAPGGRESYFWGGLSVKARAYNAFLQGQFRDSDHELGANDLNVLLAEVWGGYTHSFVGGSEISYVLRVQSSEIKSGKGDRTLAWGGIVLSTRL
ncbi:lipid A deacylase LpxR family protein [Marinobacter xestospongiae]|uniref:lipid A deacylase LpxR family protein n=1 Tax=Marinobacter xestospongiae TaxID=994319 RepID=UPI00200584D2|nr:lipid A deacylase LpxR family protein [Marinobacter xestospongiae]MCK7568939.1 lipid A deacylase LpxR family protein [Marinobacter xestospongiae]